MATELEAELLHIWQEVLEVEGLSVDDDFVARGGTPALGGQLIERLEKRFDRILHLPWLVAAPTVTQQAAWLEKRCFTGEAPSEGVVQPQSWRDYFAQRFAADPVESPAELLRPALFVLSAARTGSTLLRIMLAGHPQLFSPPELELLLFRDMQERKTGLLGGWSDFLGLERALMELQELEEPAARAQVATMLEANWSTRAVYQKIQGLCAPRLLVDKSPSYPISQPALGRLARWFSRPLCLHLVRHPLACIRSWTESNFDQVFHAPPRHGAEMDWLVSNENILQVIPAEQRLLVRYEDLVVRPEEVMREVFDFVGLLFDPAVLKPYEGKRMTDRISGLISGDKRFYQKKAIDAGAAEGSRRRPGDGPLCRDTIELAQSFGYGDL